MDARVVRLAVVQMSIETLEKERNLERSIDLLKVAVQKKAQIAVLPELCISGNSFRDIEEARTAAEEIPDGFTTRKWLQFAKENTIYIIGGVCERSNDQLHNSAVVISPEGHQLTYRKIHLWDKEKKIFAPGNCFEVIDTPFAKIGVMICFDGFFPETARILTELGAEIICQPTAEKQVFDMEMIRGRSYENAVFIATANLAGRERDDIYGGHSQITNPRGKFLAVKEGDRDGILIADIDLSEISRAKRMTEFNNVLQDRRTDLYSRLLGYSA